MTKPVPLDEQIVAALTGPCTSDQAQAVLANARAILAELTQRADKLDVDSLSPLATATEARAKRNEASDHRFEADRMEASVSALEVRVADLRDEEAAKRRDADKAAVMAVRDELAADIAEHYGPLIERLTSLAKRIYENDAECARVGIRETAEAIGRGMPANFYSGGTPLVRIMDRAPSTVEGTRLAWDFDHMAGVRWHGLAEDMAA